MNLDQFCHALHKLGLSQADQALSILWFHDEKTADIVMSAGELAKIIHNAGLGNPHSTRLDEAIRKSGKVISLAAGFRLKTLARTQIQEWLHPILGANKPAIDQELGFLPRGLWE